MEEGILDLVLMFSCSALEDLFRKEARRFSRLWVLEDKEKIIQIFHLPPLIC